MFTEITAHSLRNQTISFLYGFDRHTLKIITQQNEVIYLEVDGTAIYQQAPFSLFNYCLLHLVNKPHKESKVEVLASEVLVY